MNIKNIIFDFGGVVMNWNPRYFFRDYFNDDEKMEYFLGNIATNEWNAEQDRGRSVAEANALLICTASRMGKRYWRIMKTGTSCCVQTYQKT